MSKEWIDSFTYSIRPRRTVSSKTYFREVGDNIRKGHGTAINELRGKTLSIHEVFAVFEGYYGKNFDQEYSKEDLAVVRDIIRLTKNSNYLMNKLHSITIKLKNDRKISETMKSRLEESKPRIKSIW